MDKSTLLDKMLEFNKPTDISLIWDYIDDTPDSGSAYVIVNDEKPNIFIVTICNPYVYIVSSFFYKHWFFLIRESIVLLKFISFIIAKNLSLIIVCRCSTM